MKMLIISDLHCGDGSKSDDFGKRDKKLMDFIIATNPDKIYLNGDIYELWQHKMKNIKKAHKELCELFENKNLFEHIAGNHDYKLGGALSKSITTDNGLKVLFSHGFQGDKRMNNPFLRGFVWFLGILEKIGFKNIDNPESFSKDRVKYGVKTENYAKKMGDKYDIVICGHTHHKCVKKMESKNGRDFIYVNSGTCQHSKLEGILLDTEDGNLKLL